MEKLSFTMSDLYMSGALGAAGGALSDEDHRVRNAVLGGVAGTATGMLGQRLVPDRFLSSPSVVKAFIAAGALAPAALMHATREKEAGMLLAHLYGVKLAALDASRSCRKA